MEGCWTVYPAWPVGSRTAAVDGPVRAEKVPVVPCDNDAIERAARGASAAASADPFVGEMSAAECQSNVSMVVEYVERTGGPMHKTHHWHANVWVGGEQVCDTWCYSRAIALDEAEAALNLGAHTKEAP